MYSFGDLKNNLRRLQQVNRSMNIFARIKWSKSVIDERQIKSQPIQFYLRIIHYVLTQYSPAFYKQILDLVPNIKTLTDQKFVQSTLNIARKLFNLNPKINVDQFLQANKLVEKKLEFLVELCELIYRWQADLDRKNKKQNKQYESRDSPQKIILDEDDDEEIEQRTINVQPTAFAVEQLPPKKQLPVKIEPRQQLNKYQYQDKQTVSMAKGRPNVFPKTLYAEDEEQEDDRQYMAKATRPNVSGQQWQGGPAQGHAVPAGGKQQSTELVSRQQLNEVLQMMSTLNTTINNLVSKFNSLQVYVNGQMTKTNARLSLLQQNVKIIKDNL